jgi:hypothetical protein
MTLRLSVSTTNAVPPPIFEWYVDGRWVASGTNATLVLPQVGEAQAGTYQVVADNGFGRVSVMLGAVSIVVPYLRTEPLLPDGTFRVVLPERRDRTVVLQSSPDLIQWHSLKIIPSNAPPYVDLMPTNLGGWFFKAQTNQ